MRALWHFFSAYHIVAAAAEVASSRELMRGQQCLLQFKSRQSKVVIDKSLWWNESFSSAPIYVEPYWGISNRLRTITGAFAAGTAVGRNVVIIWRQGQFCLEDFGVLFEDLPTAEKPPEGARKLFPNGAPRCEYMPGSIKELRDVPASTPVFVKACGFDVPETDHLRYLAYHAIPLNASLREEVHDLVKELRSPGVDPIAVHIRQGTADDARFGNFFGKWGEPAGGIKHMPCCTEEAPEWACPKTASPLSVYVEMIKDAVARSNSTPRFFVAADRPDCIRDLKKKLPDVTFLHRPLLGDNGTGLDDPRAALFDMYGLAACGKLINAADSSSWTAEVNKIKEMRMSGLHDADAVDHMDGVFLSESREIRRALLQLAPREPTPRRDAVSATHDEHSHEVEALPTAPDEKAVDRKVPTIIFAMFLLLFFSSHPSGRGRASTSEIVHGSNCLAVSGFMASSSLMVLVNEMVVALFPFPGTLMALQFLACALGVKVAGALGVVEVDGLAFAKVRAFGITPIVFLATLAAKTKLLYYADAETVVVLMSTTPLAAAVLEWLFLDRELPGIISWMALLVTAAGAACFTTTGSIFIFPVYVWGSLWLIVFLFAQVYIKHVISTVPMSTWSRVYYNNVLAAIPTMVYAVSVEGAPRNLTVGWTAGHGTGAALLALSCVMGAAVSYFSFRAREALTATSFTLVGTVCKVMCLTASRIRGDPHSSLQVLLFLAACMAGATIYKAAPMRSVKKSLVPDRHEDRSTLQDNASLTAT